jgi:CRP-like cAMP-binding protein
MLTAVEKVLFLMRVPVTAEVSTDALARLASIAAEQELPPGSRLFGIGDPPDALYFVLDGAVRIDAGDGGGRLAQAAELVGGLPLFAGTPHVAQAVAVVTTRVLCVERDDLNELLDEDGEFARALFSGLLRVAAGAPSLLAG